MGKIFITGSAEGLGSLSAQALARRGHDVYLHARSAQRAADARAACPQARDVLVADLSSTEETKALAARLSALGPWDAVVHNAGVMHGADGLRGPGGLPVLFATNTLAPYLLTCLVQPPPRRHVFLSSSLHYSGDAAAAGDPDRLRSCGYSDSKLQDILLANWFARRFRRMGLGDVTCNSMDPGWVPTKMGGAGATGDIKAAVDTYVLLAEGAAAVEGQTGKYWVSSKEHSPKAEANDEETQDQLIESLAKISGVKPPE
ncbi:hypothetical protein DL766_001357 [Monosporascus sp. MC13-8B]|uniref:Uncharacterized protein n=1 Tax=Monosporascus cannonballus TaxID=155416 RepID=A0ABY0HIE2_9PEZI|nr:hypothetical protein DL763_004995 [Monosporascus cannonballus]RYO93237.1 hypothetical protein DL762_001186 [Monosporascus cannonballus]RYP37708.1 hypothetical protein DL766_001357 [Monosporascus sp. MC13-8B]